MEHKATHQNPLFATLRHAVTSFADAVDLMFNAGPRLAEVRRLASTSDLRLQERGLTRDGELSRIFDRH